MTGYGKSVAIYKGKKIHVEIKSLNSKALDLNTRLTSLYREKEMAVRQRVAQRVERGKVDFSLWTESDATHPAVSFNREIMEAYRGQLRDICTDLAVNEPEDWMRLLLSLPEVISTSGEETLCDEEWEVASQAIDEALDGLEEFRKQEGAALEKKFTEKLDNIESLLHQIEPFEQGRVEKIRQRIVSGLQSLPEVEYDRNRLEQEMIYYIEKLDISEEKQRLANHLRYFRQTMSEGHGQGKKLGFIAQEMGREINTTGSKSNQAEMQNLVVRMKDELEQIKEQVLNVM